MATAAKHMERSHRKKSSIPIQMFMNKAAVKKERKTREGFFGRLFNRTTNK